jgi:hypothetical protein
MDTGSESGLSRQYDEVDYMNTQIARSVIQIMATADGGCPHCVESLVNKFLDEYPGFYRWEIYDWIEEVDEILGKVLRKAHAV